MLRSTESWLEGEDSCWCPHWHSSRTHQLPRGFDSSCWASPWVQLHTDHCSSTFPCTADGLEHWKETQGTKISRKSSSTDCALHGMNFYCWSGRAALQSHVFVRVGSLLSVFQTRYQFVTCTYFSSFLSCRRLVIDTVRNPRSFFHFEHIY